MAPTARESLGGERIRVLAMILAVHELLDEEKSRA